MIKNRRAFIVGIKSTALSKKEKQFLKKYKPWGVILFSRNLKDFKQIKKLTSSSLKADPTTTAISRGENTQLHFIRSGRKQNNL